MRISNRPVSLLAVPLVLCALATSAHAGCAWVGWLHFSATDGTIFQEWIPSDSFNTLEQCRVAKADAEGKAATTMRQLAAINRQVQIVCLPDTVDPRGPGESK